MDINNKLTILTLIHDNKEILFGKFSDVLTHEKKIKKWKEITEQLRALDFFHKDWKYLRDTTWQNWRKRTIEKRDNRLQTGSGGGKKCKYDDIDEMVFKIIGKDSPIIEGLNVPESSGSNVSQVANPVSTATDSPPPLPSCSATPIDRDSRRKSRHISVNEGDIPCDLFDLKKEKLLLELELAKEKVQIAKREKYKLDLEILKLERELQIQNPSTFTLPFYLENGENNVLIIQENVLMGTVPQGADLGDLR